MKVKSSESTYRCNSASRRRGKYLDRSQPPSWRNRRSHCRCRRINQAIRSDERVYWRTGSWCTRHRLHRAQVPEAECLEPASGEYAARVCVSEPPAPLSHSSYQTLPWILVQEPHSYVKRRTAPAFKRVCVCERPTSLFGDVGDVNRAQARCEQGLVSITPRSVHDKCPRVFANCLGESFRSLLSDDVPPTTFARESSVEGRTIRVVAVLELRNDNLVLETRFTLYKS